MHMRKRTRGCHMTVTETSQTINFRARFFYNIFILVSKLTHQYNFFLLASFFQAGERNQRNNQP